MNLGLAAFIITLFLQPIAQILEKKGMTQVGAITAIEANKVEMILRTVTNPFVIAGVFTAAVNMALWLVALSRLKVSYIYPLGAISYIVLTLLAYFLLQERLTMTRYIGIAVIMIGAYLINR